MWRLFFLFKPSNESFVGYVLFLHYRREAVCRVSGLLCGLEGTEVEWVDFLFITRGTLLEPKEAFTEISVRNTWFWIDQGYTVTLQLMILWSIGVFKV